MNSTSKFDNQMTRDEKRKQQARINKLRADEHSRKRKEWLAYHPEVAAQEAREKEERRLNQETLRMLASMKDPPKKKTKPKNVFAALCDDSDSEEETVVETVVETVAEQAAAAKSTEEKQIVFDAGKRFDWADSDDE